MLLDEQGQDGCLPPRQRRRGLLCCRIELLPDPGPTLGRHGAEERQSGGLADPNVRTWFGQSRACVLLNSVRRGLSVPRPHPAPSPLAASPFLEPRLPHGSGSSQIWDTAWIPFSILEPTRWDAETLPGTPLSQCSYPLLDAGQRPPPLIPLFGPRRRCLIVGACTVTASGPRKDSSAASRSAFTS